MDKLEPQKPGAAPILIAEDDPISRKILEAMLKRWGYSFITTDNGRDAWELIKKNKPKIVLLDWMMPEIEGPALAKMVRENEELGYVYIILLTIKDRVEDRISGLQAGADDYVTKPYDSGELKSRINTGWRIINLELELARKISDLQDTLTQVKQLQGLLPICSYCKKIRDDQNYWQQVENYIGDHSEVKFSHGICPDCYQKHVVPLLEPPGDKETEEPK